MLRVDAVSTSGNHVAVACSRLNGPQWTGAVMTGQYDAEAGKSLVDVNHEHEAAESDAKSSTLFFQSGIETDAGIASIQFVSDTFLVGINDGGELVAFRRRGDGPLVSLYAMPGHDDVGTALAVSPTADSCASVSLDGSVRVWRVSETMATCDAVLLGHSGAVNGVAWAAGGLASVSADCTVRLWETGTRRGLTKHALPSPGVCAAWLDDGRLACGTATGLVLLDPRAASSPAPLPAVPSPAPIGALAADDTRVFFGTDAGTVMALDLRSGATTLLRAHGDFVRGLARCGTTLVSGGWDGKVFFHKI
eukprot:m.22689 g.22689  ORF g.22689 m.22689 type:complete len:307 (-) comp8343_c0_seq1:258-1178(-)